VKTQPASAVRSVALTLAEPSRIYGASMSAQNAGPTPGEHSAATKTEDQPNSPLRGFGTLELLLYEYLKPVSPKARAAHPKKRWDVVLHVYAYRPKNDAPHPKRFAERSRNRQRYLEERRQQFLNRLRQLARQVNRKLRSNGSNRRVFSPKKGYITCGMPPPTVTPAKPAPVVPNPYPHLSFAAQRCVRLILDCLNRGVTRSAEIQKVCCGEWKRNWIAYRAARKELGLQAKRCWDGSKWFWEVVFPNPISHRDDCDTLQQNAIDLQEKLRDCLPS